MYVRLNAERHGFDKVERSTVTFDDGWRLVIYSNGNLVMQDPDGRKLTARIDVVKATLKRA